VPGARLQLATKEISRLTTLDKMNVSRALQALEARGILRRAQDPNDGRKRIVMLTTQGRALSPDHSVGAGEGGGAARRADACRNPCAQDTRAA